MIWRFNLTGELVDSFAQAEEFGAFGLSDPALADNGVIYAAPVESDSQLVFQLDSEWSVISAFAYLDAPIRGMAYDEELDVLYLRHGDGTVHTVNQQGVPLEIYTPMLSHGEAGSMTYYANGLDGPVLLVLEQARGRDIYLQTLHLATGEFEQSQSFTRDQYRTPVSTLTPSGSFADEMTLVRPEAEMAASLFAHFRLNFRDEAMAFPAPLVIPAGETVDIPFTLRGPVFGEDVIGFDIFLLFAQGASRHVANLQLRLWETDADDVVTLPLKTELHPAYPNPFNPATTLTYSLARSSEVQITLFNVLGQQVDVLQQGQQAAGAYRLGWDAGHLASGVYIVRMEADGKTFTQKMMLMK